MFKLEAPYPGYQTTTVLPSPDWANNSNSVGTVQVLRAMNGLAQTYKKNKQGRRKLQWSFLLSRHKSIELKSFVQSYYSSAMRITDSYNNIYIAYLLNNPFELGSGERAGSFPGDETQRATLEFEEKI